MIKHSLILTIAILLQSNTPTFSQGVENGGVVHHEQLDTHGIKVNINQQNVMISGACGQTLEVISPTGRRVIVVKIINPIQRIELNIPKGCYILKIGTVVRKVSIC